MSFDTLSLPSSTIYLSYYQQLYTSGGTGSVVFTLTSGALPNGLYLTNTGIISGNPTQSGNFNFTVTATDEVGTTVPESYTLTINPGVTVTTTLLASWTAGLSTSPSTVTGQYLQTLAATGGTRAADVRLRLGLRPTADGP